MTLTQMYGHRARIGYTSVAYVTEVFPYAFYKIAPKGVSLALLTIHQEELHRQEMDRLYKETIMATAALAKSGVDLIVLGGRPVLLSRGAENIDGILAELQIELGVKVTSDATAQVAAYRALESRRIATVHPFAEQENDRHDNMVRQLGLQPAGCKAGGSNLIELPTLPPSAALAWGREAKHDHPEADTLLFPCPHWAVIEVIDQLEAELEVNVITNLQATIWHALRLCGIEDKIDGYGRLLREC